MNPRAELPVDVYVRVSRRGEREDDRFHSPREQEERARAYAEGRGLSVAEVIEDIDVSGGTHPEERPGMARALERIRSGQSGGLVAFSLDRLSRDPSHGDWLVREVTSHGAVISSPDMPEDITSPTGEFTFGMLLGVARLYRRTAGTRFFTAKERAIKAGIPVGKTPVGYRQREDRRLELDPDTSPAVRELYERRARGESWGALVRILDEATGRRWSRQSVPVLVRNRLYATGRLEYGDVVSDWDAGAIVDEALWHAAQSAPQPLRRPRSHSGWLLTGLLTCAACGHNLAPTTAGTGEHRGKYRSYRCQYRACPARAHVNADRMERWTELQTFAVGDDITTRSLAADLGALEEAVALADRRLDQVLAPEARDALGDLWAPDVKARRSERDVALARLGEARELNGVPSSEFRLRDVWDGMDNPDRRAALSLFWKEIRVGRPGDGGIPLTFVARGPQAEAEVVLPPNSKESA